MHINIILFTFFTSFISVNSRYYWILLILRDNYAVYFVEKYPKIVW